MTAQAQAAQQGKKAKTAITPTRAEDFPEWYQQVVRAADMAENSPVRGCMVIKPYGYAVWENMQRIFDDMIKEEGVQNAYFPLLIPLSFLSREAEHVDGFAKECAVVTHHRLEAGEGGLVPAAPLEEPLVIRPTSETIIGDSMARWVQSYRDLPLKLNQWCNVMRWEMRTRLFLRTSEFLWQEGHNAFETEDEARGDARRMLDLYVDFVRDSLALPAIPGEKTEDEKFPGAVNTYTFEMMMQDGKALQSGTSHYLGQNFARSCGIRFQSRDGQEAFAHTTSWGVSTRLIGGMIMAHGDDDGMVMPPRVAPQQIIVIPILRDDGDSSAVLEYCAKIVVGLKAQAIRAVCDSSEERTPNKIWTAIKKGVPVRVEVGPRDMEAGAVTHTRRDLGRESKETCGVDEFIAKAPALLDAVHDALYARAEKFQNEHIVTVSSLAGMQEFFAAGQTGFTRCDAALLADSAFAPLAKGHALTPRCLPFADEGRMVIVGKAY